MNFEVFDRTTEKEKAPESPKIRINASLGHLSFNKSAVDALVLTKAVRVKFLRFGKQWFVAKTEEDTGYKLAVVSRAEFGGLKCYSRISSNAILRNFKVEEDIETFYLQKTHHEFHHHPVFELVPVPKSK